MDFLLHRASGWGSGACLLSSLACLFPGRGLCSIMDFLVRPASGWVSGACFSSSLLFLFSTGVCQTVPCILNCTWPWWKHALLLFGVYTGVIMNFVGCANPYSILVPETQWARGLLQTDPIPYLWSSAQTCKGVHETWPLCEVRMYDHVEHGHERCCPFPPGTRSVCIYKYILSVSAGGLISYPTILSMTGTVKLLIMDSCGQRCRSPPKAVFHGSGWRGVIAVISWSRWQLQLLGNIVI